MTKAKKIKPTRAEMKRQIMEIEAQLAIRYYFAHKDLGIFGPEKMFGSGVILSLDFIGGGSGFRPVMIRDGLSEGTIERLKADIQRSFATATQLTPGKSDTSG